MTRYLMQLLRSASFYPLGTFWAVAMAIIPAIVAGWIELGVGLLILTMLVVALLIIANHRDTVALRSDIERVHKLVNSQHDKIMARVEQLTDTLLTHDVPVPADPHEEGASHAP